MSGGSGVILPKGQSDSASVFWRIDVQLFQSIRNRLKLSIRIGQQTQCIAVHDHLLGKSKCDYLAGL
jgi:predicted NBD/HSP70 family sugar kinase